MINSVDDIESPRLRKVCRRLMLIEEMGLTDDLVKSVEFQDAESELMRLLHLNRPGNNNS